MFMGLFLFSCFREKGKGDSVLHTGRINPGLISRESKELAFKDDTLFFRGKKFEGVLFSLDNEGRDSVSVESYSNGLLNGVSKKWYSNGQLMEIRYYKQGQKNGKQTAYWENGKKRFEFIAKADQYEGVLKEWNTDGRLIHLANFVNGQEEGPQRLWYDNGKIRANYIIMNGKRYGLLGTKNCKNVSDSIFALK